MSISIERIAADIERIATFSESPAEVGFSRPTFSQAWLQARDYVIEQALEVGCYSRIDAAGNVHLRPFEHADHRPVWISGSHLDSVPTGGKFDGVIGVVIPLEVLRAFPHLPLELVIFAEEEGTTFQLGMIGSHAWVGELTPDQIASLTNCHGQNYLQAGVPCGVRPESWQLDRLNPADYCGFVEVHAEQGPLLWQAAQPVGIVSGIVGRRQFAVTVVGAANHAGTTPMKDRRDALACAAKIISQIEQLALQLSSQDQHTVLTVGRVEVHPNAVNVIPGRVTFTVDLRAVTQEVLEHGQQQLERLLASCASTRSLEFRLQRTESLMPIPMSRAICQSLQHVAQRLGCDLTELCSGALHDAAILAPYVPTAMLFVASRDGISHHPDEFSRLEDIAMAAEILAEFIAEPFPRSPQ